MGCMIALVIETTDHEEVKAPKEMKAKENKRKKRKERKKKVHYNANRAHGELAEEPGLLGADVLAAWEVSSVQKCHCHW